MGSAGDELRDDIVGDDGFSIDLSSQVINDFEFLSFFVNLQWSCKFRNNYGNCAMIPWEVTMRLMK